MIFRIASLLVISYLPLNTFAQSVEQLEEVFVTGERVNRSIQDTSSSVVVTTPFELDSFAGADTLDQVLKQTANVTTSGAGNQGPTVRGSNSSGVLTSLESFFGGSQPRTTIQVDGRQITFNEFVYSTESVWDIQRIEIFRGPQTTTQGRNAIAGAVFIETAAPNHQEFEGRFRALVGDNSTRQVSAALSSPIGDGPWAYRISGDYREEQSTVMPLGVELNQVNDLRDISNTNVRAKLGYKPSDSDTVDALLTFTHTDSSRPQTESVDLPFEERSRFNPQFSVFDTQADTAVARVNYKLNQEIKLVSTTSYSDVSVQRLAPIGAGNADINSKDYTQELIASFGDSSDRVSGLAGIYLSNFESDETLDLSGFGIGIGSFNDERDSFGAFVEASYSFNSNIHLTAGGRYQQDEQIRNGGFTGVIPIDFDQKFDDFLPKLELAIDVSDSIRIGLIAEKGFNAGGFTFNFDTFEAETFKDESLLNYELFFRGQLMDDRLTLNANLFYNDIDDVQIATLVEIAPNFIANVFSNASQANVLGAEVDLRFVVNDKLTLQAGLGLSSTEFKSDSDAGALITGNEFQRSPGLTAVGGAIWSFNDTLDMSLFGRYSGGYFSDDANFVVNRVSSYKTLDFQISYQLDKLRLYADVTNLFDEFQPVALFDDATLGNILAPRTASVGIEYEF